MSSTVPERVDVVFASADVQAIVGVDHVPGMTAIDAVTRSRLAERYPEIHDSPLVLGRFGERIELDALVEPGDRIEICRPLRADPRQKRRELSRDGRVIGDR